MKPVFVINGFLDSGKTEFIRFTLEQPYFRIKGRTLLILCEEGELEYEDELLERSRTDLVLLEDEENMTAEYLLELEKEYSPERIVIEYNGMWNYKNRRFPWHWQVEQQITMIDGSTFPMYYTNMRSLLTEMLRESDMIVLNRCDGLGEELSRYRRNIKAVNPRAEVIFEDSTGEINAVFEEDLPYDLKQPVIDIKDEAFGIWYLDCMENTGRYVGKTVRFTGQVMKPRNFGEDYFVPGRLAMTCCADDMTVLGYACESKEAAGLTERSWVKITARVELGYLDQYGGEGPILRAREIVAGRRPKDEVIRFI